MARTVTTRYDVAEHLRTPEEMAAYLEACFEEADGRCLHRKSAGGCCPRERYVASCARRRAVAREPL